MKPTQDPKFGIDDDGRICNIATGEPIPADEPVFIFRAKDMLAEQALLYYYALVSMHDQRLAVHHRITDFKRFRQDNPELMKAPDTVYPFPEVK
ncbi:MAG: hypothetical protein U9Q19_05415 [Pseudomonadota bacterium]|nr:hypothetical protein [Pseudomonadota bacterium]